MYWAYCRYVKGVSSWKLHVYERVTFSVKNATQKGRDLDLGAEPPSVKLD